jgi:hypothetical protein
MEEEFLGLGSAVGNWLADSDTICVAERPVSEAVFGVFETGEFVLCNKYDQSRYEALGQKSVERGLWLLHQRHANSDVLGDFNYPFALPIRPRICISKCKKY